jgi:sialic acid synthase SpsE
MNTKFIAEIGSNHNGKIERVFELINMAKQIGCWGVKLQAFKADHLWQKPVIGGEDIDGSRWAKAKQRELPMEWLPAIHEYARLKDIKIGYSVFHQDLVSAVSGWSDFLKIASYEISNINLICEMSKCHKPTFISLGLSDENEFLDIYNKFNWDPPDQLIPMLCVSKYPAEPRDCNLRMINKFYQAGYEPVGWSDHTRSEAVIHGAICMDAEWIEFHVDLDDGKGWENDKHCWSMGRAGHMITRARKLERAIGVADWNVIKESRTDTKHRHNPETGVRGE